MTDRVNKDRVFWIDCFKVLAIILVVLGHATGRFNRYIYQFHMAAFFFISGYCTHWGKGRNIKTLWNRLYTLIFPLITIFVLGTFLMSFLNYLGVYSIIWGEGLPYIGLKNTFWQFFSADANYVWWMGACWFLEVLFGICLLHACIWGGILAHFEKYANKVFALCITILYIVGYLFVRKEITFHNIDLVFIAQFYFGVGTLFARCNLNLKNRKIKYRSVIWILMCILSIGFMYKLAGVDDITVDYPARRFNYIVLNCISALNGIAFLYSVSRLVDVMFGRIRIIKNTITYIGKNTISVVFFHFLFFKFVYLILLCLGEIDVTFLSNFTPADPIGYRYSILFLIVSIGGSIGLWNLFTFSNMGRILFGVEPRFREMAYERIISSRFMRSCRSIGTKLCFFECKFKKYLSRKGSISTFSLIVGYICFLLSPIMIQGVILNDELQARLSRISGYGNFLKECIKNEFRMGRPLRIFAAINTTFSFLTNSMSVNKIIQILILIITVFCFGRLIDCLFSNRRLTYITSFLILFFLPVTVEHAVPNAFIGLVCIPIIWLCLSLTAWCQYLIGEDKKSLLFAIVCWIISLLGYEYMVTYAPIYVLIYFLKRPQKKRNLKDFVKKVTGPVIIGCVYIIATFTLQRFSGSVYSGASVGFVSLASTWNILKTLNRSAWPGYFLGNPKYQYLVCWLYTGEKYDKLYAANSNIQMLKDRAFWQQAIDFLLKYIITPRLVVLALGGIVILFAIRSMTYADNREKWNLRKHLIVMLCIALYSLIPILPNSISELYQTTVSDSFFTSLPVSLAIHFAVCLLIGYVVVLIIDKKNRGLAVIISISAIILVGTMVQAENGIIGDIQHQDYARLRNIERLFDTECMKNMDNSVIYSKDIFETRNLLAVHDSYWDEIAKLHDYSMKFTQEDGIADFELYLIDDEYFVIIGSEEIAVMSEKKLPNTFKIMTESGKYALVTSNKYSYDNGYLCYRFSRDLQPLESNETAFEQEFKRAGSTLDTANVLCGYYDDGWVAPKAEIELYSGKAGTITLAGYYPQEIGDRELIVSVSVDGIETCSYKIVDNEFEFSFEVTSGKIVRIGIDSNFAIDTNNDDIRELSFIMSRLEAQ